MRALCCDRQGSASDPKTTLGQGVKMLKGGGGIFKSAAVAVLRLERRLMTTGDITKYGPFETDSSLAILSIPFMVNNILHLCH